MTSPVYGSTTSLAASTTSANVVLNAAQKASWTLRVVNIGPNVAMVRLGNGASTAATLADYPIPPNQVFEVMLDRAPGPGAADYFAAICPTGTATLYISAVAQN